MSRQESEPSFEPLVLPVGMPLGFFVLDGDEVAEIRRGGLRHELSPDLYEFWGQLARLTTRSALFEWANAEDIANGAEALSELERVGLVVELRASIRHDDRTLARHRLLPMAFGLGNTDTDRALFHIAGPNGKVLASMRGFTYAVWSLSDGYLSLKAAYETAAELLGVGPQDVFAALIRDLPSMLERGIAILDAVGSEPVGA